MKDLRSNFSSTNDEMSYRGGDTKNNWDVGGEN